MKKQSGNAYNMVALVFLLLSVVTCLCTSLIVTENINLPDALVPPTDVPLPTQGIARTSVPTITPTELPPPTWTPSPPPGATQPPADADVNNATPVISPT